MISGMAVWGGVGWLLDRWWDTRVFLPVGVILGMAVAIYLVIKRYGGAPPTAGEPRAGNTRDGRQNPPGDDGGTQKGRR
jgi:F0F1-type ATP synthase assembly protein I